MLANKGLRERLRAFEERQCQWPNRRAAAGVPARRRVDAERTQADANVLLQAPGGTPAAQQRFPAMQVSAITDAPQQAVRNRKRAKALLLSDRIDTSNLEHDGVVSTAPLSYRCGKDGFVTLFRYGVVVMIGLSAAEEED